MESFKKRVNQLSDSDSVACFATAKNIYQVGANSVELDIDDIQGQGLFFAESIEEDLSGGNPYRGCEGKRARVFISTKEDSDYYESPRFIENAEEAGYKKFPIKETIDEKGNPRFSPRVQGEPDGYILIPKESRLAPKEILSQKFMITMADCIKGTGWILDIANMTENEPSAYSKVLMESEFGERNFSAIHPILYVHEELKDALKNGCCINVQDINEAQEVKERLDAVKHEFSEIEKCLTEDDPYKKEVNSYLKELEKVSLIDCINEHERLDEMERELESADAVLAEKLAIKFKENTPSVKKENSL